MKMLLCRLTRYKLILRSSREQFWSHTLYGYSETHAATSVESVVRALGRRLCPPPAQQQCQMATLHSWRNIHTTRPRYVNPILLFVVRPISKVLAVLVGRGFRKWWQALPKKRKEVLIQHLIRNKLRYLGGSAVLGCAGYTYYESHVTTTPVTGRRRFMIFTPDQLFTVAHHTYQMEMAQYGHLLMPQTHPMVEQVRRVGNQILQANNDIPQLYTKSWTVAVIDDPLVNCFVLPSGQMVMFRGMMELFDNDDQVAVVLAHEMSHAILEHTAEQLSHGYLLDILILLPLAVIWAFIPSDGLAIVTHWFLNQVVQILLQLPYSRTLEMEADSVGLQISARACYDVRESSAFWGKMSVMDQLRQEQGKRGEEPAWLSTHPSHNERQDMLNSLMSEALTLRDSCQCPRLKQRDPRHSIWMLQKGLTQSSIKEIKHEESQGTSNNMISTDFKIPVLSTETATR